MVIHITCTLHKLNHSKTLNIYLFLGMHWLWQFQTPLPLEHLMHKLVHLVSYHQVVTKMHCQRHKILVSRSWCFPIITKLKVYNNILIKFNPQILMVSIILTMGMFCQQHCGQTLVICEGMYLCPNYNTYKIARPCYKLVKELTAQRLWE